MAVCGAYGVLLLIACMIFRATGGGPPDALAEEITRTDARIRTSDRTLKNLQGELAAEQWKLDSCRAVGKQPDWGVLLRLLAEKLSHEVVLKQCQLVRAEDTPPPATAAAAPEQAYAQGGAGGGRFVLVVNGLGRSHTAVSQFVLRLEKIGLFDRVTLIKTSRESFVKGQAVAFQLECLLVGKGGAAR